MSDTLKKGLSHSQRVGMFHSKCDTQRHSLTHFESSMYCSETDMNRQEVRVHYINILKYIDI